MQTWLDTSSGHFFCFKQAEMPDGAHIAQRWQHLGLRTDFTSHIYLDLYLDVFPLLLIIGQISMKPWLSLTVSISHYTTRAHVCHLRANRLTRRLQLPATYMNKCCLSPPPPLPCHRQNNSFLLHTGLQVREVCMSPMHRH